MSGRALYYNAAETGDEALVSHFIEQGAEVDWRDDDNSTALHAAAQYGHTPVITRLLDSGWSLEARSNSGITPLTRAAGRGHLETVKTLMLRGANIDTQDNKWTPLHWASRLGESRVVKILLQCGADQQIKDKDGKTAEDAAKNEETRAVFREFNELHLRVFLKANNQKIYFWKLLEKAINEENHDVAVILILRGAKLEGTDTFDKLIELTEKYNILDANFVKALVNKETDLPSTSYRNLFEWFHLAEAHRATDLRQKIEKCFISKIDVVDEDGNTLLHCAALFNNEHVLKILLDNGATSTHFVKNKRDEIPLDIATRNEKIFRMVVIDFLSFALKAKDFKAEDFQKKLGYGLELFCLRRNRRGVTLLQYISDHGLVKEREELLQLLIKIDKHRYKFNEEESEKRIIRILQAGMKPCKGLKETIDSLQEKYCWTKGKMIVKGLLSTLFSFAVGFVLYFFDVFTDIKFTVEMFSHTTTNFTEDLERCQTENIPQVSNVSEFCTYHGLESEDCFSLINSAIQTCNQYKVRFQQPGIWQDIGNVSAAHIIMPLIAMICFFGLSILNKIISINWLLPLRIPWPPLTKTYETILNWQIFYNYTKDKTTESYERQDENLMIKVEDHQILTNLSLIIEASFESSFQFFFQGVFFFPTLILACIDVSGASELKNLVDWKIVSIIISFLSFSWTSLNIRYIEVISLLTL